MTFYPPRPVSSTDPCPADWCGRTTPCAVTSDFCCIVAQREGKLMYPQSKAPRFVAAPPDDLDCSCGSAAGERCKATVGLFRKRPRCPERGSGTEEMPPYVPLRIREAGPAAVAAWHDPLPVLAERDRLHAAIRDVLALRSSQDGRYLLDNIQARDMLKRAAPRIPTSDPSAHETKRIV